MSLHECLHHPECGRLLISAILLAYSSHHIALLVNHCRTINKMPFYNNHIEASITNKLILAYS